MNKMSETYKKDQFGFILLSIYLFGGLGLEALRRISGSFDNDFFSERLYVTNESVGILFIQSIVMLTVFIIGRNYFTIPVIHRTNNALRISPYLIYFGVLCFLSLFIVFHLEYIWLDDPDRFEGGFYVNALITLGSSILILAHNAEKFRPLSIISILLFFTSLTYAAATASRSAAIPFLAFAACAFVSRNKITALALALLAVKALLTSLGTRTDPSFANFVEEFFSFDPSELWNNFTSIVSLSFPAGYTVQAALDAQSSPDSLWANILYLSPIPSSWLPEEIFVKSTLSDVFGIDSNVLGINTDIYSDPIYRAGLIGAFTYPVFFFGLYFMSMLLSFSMPKRWQYSAVLTAKTLALYGLIGGMVFSYRSATRWQLVFILSLALYIRMTKKRNINK
jgi:hypothetical protein